MEKPYKTSTVIDRIFGGGITEQPVIRYYRIIPAEECHGNINVSSSFVPVVFKNKKYYVSDCPLSDMELENICGALSSIAWKITQ